MTTSEQIRRDAGHPIIDADGHVLEVLEATYPHLREALGATRFEEWRARGPIARLAQRPRTTDDRLRTRTPQGAWWGTQTVNVRDRATATLPALLAERSEEIGIDYFVLYPTNTLLTCAEEDPELRQGLCAGFGLEPNQDRRAGDAELHRRGDPRGAPRPSATRS